MVIVEKFDWFGENQIFSIDIHPTDKKFAICQDSTISIWKFPSIEKFNSLQKQLNDNYISELSTIDSSILLLAKIKQHNLTVNVCRFSPNGEYLVAGSDDKTASLFQYKGINSLTQQENWLCIKIFRDHEQDVLDVEWYRDSNILASCSVDNKIHIYDISQKTRIKTLEGHTSHVKGLSFDPIGKYLISQGADKKVIVWNVNNWDKVKEITEPFEKSVDAIFFRFNWSPNGEYIFIPGGFSHGHHQSSVIKRSDFSVVTPISGHSDIVMATNFNQQLFYDKEDKTQFVTYVAIGSQDSILSIWNTNDKKAFFVTKKLFKEGISDLRWTNDGLKLLVSSRDGCIACLEFTEEELGKRVPAHLKKQKINEIYGDIGDSFNIFENPTSLKSTTFNEVVVKTKTTKQIDQKVGKKRVELQQVESMKDGKRKIQPQQIESVKNGKRRIQPFRSDSSSVPQTFQQVEQIEEEEEFDKMEEESEEMSEEEIIRESKEIFKKRPRSENAKYSTNFIERRQKEDKIYFRINSKEEIKCNKQGNIEYILDGAVKLIIPLKETILMATANANFIAVIGASNSLHIFTNGVRAFPPIALSSIPTFIACNKQNDLVVLCQDSMLNVWNVGNKECTIECTVDALVAKSEEGEIDDVGLHENGIPIVTINTGESYSYDVKMKSWICIADSHTPFSPFISNIEIYNSDDNYSLRSIKKRAIDLNSSLSRNHTTSQEERETIEDFEIGMQSAESLKDEKEYLRYTRAYARQISTNNDFNRLNQLCSSLLLDESKRNLLKDVLDICSLNKPLQRTVSQYKSILEELMNK
eukprot:gene5265-8883_t